MDVPWRRAEIRLPGGPARAEGAVAPLDGQAEWPEGIDLRTDGEKIRDAMKDRSIYYILYIIYYI